MASKIETKIFAKSVSEVMTKKPIAEILDDMPMLFILLMVFTTKVEHDYNRRVEELEEKE